MGPTWVLSTPDGPHLGPMNFVIREVTYLSSWRFLEVHAFNCKWLDQLHVLGTSESGPWSNIKMQSYPCKESHGGYKTVIRDFLYWQNGIFILNQHPELKHFDLWTFWHSELLFYTDIRHMLYIPWNMHTVFLYLPLFYLLKYSLFFQVLLY